MTDELARRLRHLIAADIQIGVTGLTTPGGSETVEKPVGTMFISALIKGRLVSVRQEFKGSPEEIIHQTVNAAADLLIREVNHKS